MKICGACREELPREDFSKKQWQVKTYRRRCRGCVEADQEVQAEDAPRPMNDNDDESHDGRVQCQSRPPPGASCWICLE